MWFNPIMIWLLKSPLHSFVSKNVMLVTVTGRKSGKQISTPTNYLRDGNSLWVISWRERNWWKNLRSGAKALVLEEVKAVSQNLFEYYKKVPQVAKYVQIGLDPAGLPIPADCERAATKLVVVKIDLNVV
jgi:hypothetical protein